MSCVLKAARKKTPDACVAMRCSKDKCSVSLDGMRGNRLIIDTEHKQSPGYSEADEKCDYLFISEPSDNEVWIAPMEFKAGRVSTSKTVDQLQSGARVAELLIPPQALNSHNVRFRPVLVYQKLSIYQRLKKKKVRLGNYHENIRLLLYKKKQQPLLLRAFDP